MDLHAAQIQGFFDIPVDHLYSSMAFTEYFKALEITDLTVVAPDVGSLIMARAYAKRLGVRIAFIDKRRPEPNAVEVLNIVGEIEGRNILIIDDMVDTAGTLCEAAKGLKAQGANHIYCAATHGLLSGPAIERLEASPIEKMIVTNTISIPDDKLFPVPPHFGHFISPPSCLLQMISTISVIASSLSSCVPKTNCFMTWKSSRLDISSAKRFAEHIRKRVSALCSDRLLLHTYIEKPVPPDRLHASGRGGNLPDP